MHKYKSVINYGKILVQILSSHLLAIRLKVANLPQNRVLDLESFVHKPCSFLGSIA